MSLATFNAHNASRTAAQQLVACAVAGVSVVRTYFYFGYWYSHWRA